MLDFSLGGKRWSGSRNMILKQYGLERLFANGVDKTLNINLGRITAQHNKIYTITTVRLKKIKLYK